ncbi:MAG: ATP-binding cassette domain-containing protein, partial [Sneathiellales bacterium]|nr:ATP-binding cassette domain-containing protein [Sneathiellales bacterium]
LSGGQRQRIALARALYGNPSILVLDEPNASLDNVGESALMEAIQTLRDQGMTIVVIAHRPNILKHVDKIVVLRNGMVDDFGARDEILDKLQGPQHRAIEGPKPPVKENIQALPSSVSGENAEKNAPSLDVKPAFPASAKQADKRDNGHADRIARLQALKNRAAQSQDRSSKIEQHPAVKPIPEAEIKTPAPITEKVRSEILSLAGRPLTEGEVQEIYTLYSSGNRQKMLEKLKGVG